VGVMRVVISIDQLRLTGFDPRSGDRVGDALERALAEGIDIPEGLASGALEPLESLSAADARLSRELSDGGAPEEVGRAVADSLRSLLASLPDGAGATMPPAGLRPRT
jgi:hypothetical protein